MSKYVNDALVLLRHLNYPNFYAIPRPDINNIKSFKQELYEVLINFFKFRLCDPSLFQCPQDIIKAKDFDELFRALDAYYAENFGNRADPKSTATGVYFDRMLHLLISNVASKYDDEFKHCLFYKNHQFDTTINIDFKLGDDQICSHIRDILMMEKSSNNQNKLIDVFERQEISLEKLVLSEKTLVAVLKNPISSTDMDATLKKIRKLMYYWVVIHHNIPSLTVNDIVVSESKPIDTFAKNLKITFYCNNRMFNIFSCWKNGDLVMLQNLTDSGIVVKKLISYGKTTDNDFYLIIHFRDPHSIHDFNIWKKIRSCLISCIDSQLRMKLQESDIKIEKCFDQ